VLPYANKLENANRKGFYLTCNFNRTFQDSDNIYIKDHQTKPEKKGKTIRRKSLQEHSCLRTRLGDWGGILFPLYSVSYSLSTKLITVTWAYYLIIPSCFSLTGWHPAKHLTEPRQYKLPMCICAFLST